MAPGFPTTFEKDQSPLSPMSAAASGSNTPISYKANVNRNKTKKWADAKPVDYGGDDWGEDDDYDDPPPPPIPKATGLRQPGQGLQSGPQSIPTPVDNKKHYGDLPPLPSAAAAGSSFGRPRVNSFDADDEKRNFSNNTLQSPSADTTPTPATRFSQITGAPALHISTQPTQPPPQQLPQNDGVSGLRKGSQVVLSPKSGSPHPDALLPGPAPERMNTGDSSAAFSGPSRMNTGESGSVYSQPSDVRTPSSDYQARRDFSPTAVPAPLSTTRASPAPQSATETPSTRFPARKSSLSQSTGPELSQIVPPNQDSTAPKPWIAGRSSSPGSSARSPTTPSAKALPFIRPSDIYKRMEEEKERERQSMESSRPSMDSIVGARASDRSDSPAKPPLREKTSSDSLGDTRQRGSFERDDVPASGRHLQPMLAPVRERKSEYGFEGFNINEQAAQAAEQTPAPNESAQLDIQEARQFSVSPKLPDLNRMSGFGIDLFSQPKPEEQEPPLLLPRESEHPIDPIAVSDAAPTQSEETAPGRQPSLGYRSVVNQAFDRTDDSSVPPTPASQTGSAAGRSDSERTGTTGISPIMSRAPSGGVYDIRGREGANSSILEVVHEPASTVAQEEMRAQSQDDAATPTIGPDHRRDVRTPSPGNSPARKPDPTRTEAVVEGREAVFADRSAEDGEARLQPPRPISEREGSFRPSLPGAWTSYATTDRSETPQQESTRVSEEVERTQTPTNQHDDRGNDVMPSTTKKTMPQSAVEAVGGAALVSVAAASLGSHDKDAPNTGSLAIRENSALPTPDPAMAPSGNVYSSAPLDLRLLPKLKSVTPEAQLRPGPPQTETELASSDAPPPPAKDTPNFDDSESFRPPVPLKQRTLDQVEADENFAPPMRPQVLPTLSTDTRPEDEESDKLRKEIINSLSPKHSDAASRNESLQPEQLDDQAAPNDGRLSYLPREYDNYWASTSAEDTGPAPLAVPAAQTHTQIPQQSEELAQSNATAVMEPPPRETAPPIPPLSARRTSLAAETRPPMPHRFSWETSAEDVSLARSQEEVPEVPTIPTHQEPYHDGPSEVAAATANEAVPAESSTRSPQEPYSQHGNMDYDKELGAQGLASPVSEPSDDGHIGRDAALLAGGAALGGAAAAVAVQSYSAQSPQHAQQSQRRLSLAEEKDPRVSSYPVSPTPPEDEHPSRSPQAHFSGPSTEQPLHYAGPRSVSPIHPPVKTQFTPASRILAFKEIAAIKDPHERIQTFDEMRHRFANMDSGLFDWMTTLKAQHPEHANATGSWSGAAFAAPIGSARSKYSKATGQALPQLQQPYYQQYLNASPTTPGTPVSRPGPSTPSGSQQGFSPAGGKLTSQQVQAQGKELLHKAGIFGGKAGKAGKGLLAKGKNKLRGSGAGDKTSPNLSPPAKPKSERRTSWGFPLAISRSSARLEASARESKETISMPMPTPERHQQATATTPQRTFPSLGIPNNANYDSPQRMSGDVNSPESQTQQPIESTQSRGLAAEHIHNDEQEERGYLGIPAPITKTQPSWDPFNATPIAEEEGFQFEDRSMQQPQNMRSAAPPKALATLDNAGSKSERSNSGDAQLYDASEEPSDLNDWVMVSPELESKSVRPKEPEARPVSHSYQPPPGPPPGLLERQKMQPVEEPQLAMTQAEPSITAIGQTVQPRFDPRPRPRSEVYEPPSGPPPSFLNLQQTQPIAEPQIRQAPTQPSASVTSQPRALPQLDQVAPAAGEEPPTHAPNQQSSQNKLEPLVSRSSQDHLPSVLNRPRFSYEAPAQPQPTSPASPAQHSSAYGDMQQHVRTANSLTQQNSVHGAREQQVQEEVPQQPPRNTSFKGLPPIRRTSTFGLGFGRRSKPQFPISDEEELSRPYSQHDSAAKNYEAEIGAAAGAGTVAAYANHHEHNDTQQRQIHHTAPTSTNLAQQRRESMEQLGPSRPQLTQAHSSDYSERTAEPQISQAHSPSDFQAPRAPDVPPEGFRRSQDAWRPNAALPTIQTSPTRHSASAMSPPHRLSFEQERSMEGQRNRGYSETSQSTSRPEAQYNDRGPRPVQAQPTRSLLYNQPPSSAQRYPELFQTQQQPLADLSRDGELPSDMYQAPIPREAAFLPRQQTNEYQLPGVGPPTEEPRHDRSRRNSGGVFKDLAGRISRGTSRERLNSISRDGEMSPAGQPMESRGYEYPESSIASDEAQDQKKRRSSFFGNLNRASTTGLGPPQSRESVIAHFPGSRTDLLGTPQQSPVDRKKSFFGTSSPGSPKVKPNKLSRSSTSGMVDEPAKKKRFSGLSSMFSRSGNPDSRASDQNRPQATRELSYNERQLLESPQLDPRQAAQPSPHNQNRNPREPSQPRQFLTKLSTSGDPSKSRQESKARRSSTSNLLSGIMGRKSEQKDRAKEDSSSQGSKTRSQASQPINPQHIPLGQTYTDLQEESSRGAMSQPPSRIQQPQPTRYEERPPQPQTQERGRRASREPQSEVPREAPREPQYNSVRIPGGYSLVRGEGAMTAPTDYDPRGISRFQQGQQVDPRYMQPQQQAIRGPQQQSPQVQGSPSQGYGQQTPIHPHTESPRTSQATKPPNLSPVETYESYTKRSSRRLSREDLLARSPAREQPGQQRPYQLSLPEDEKDRDPRPMSLSKLPPVISPPMRSPPTLDQPRMKKHDAIQHLQQPVLRHPESPAGYPLPDDAVFSPVNEAARDIPPPPPPKWPKHLDAHHGLDPNQHISTQHLQLVESELDRSNTRRTAVSAVSGMSGPQSAGLHVPKEGNEGTRITPSPTPPSPAYTPEEEQSPPRYSLGEKALEALEALEAGLDDMSDESRERALSGHSERGGSLGDTLNPSSSQDLYNASPRLRPSGSGNGVPNGRKAGERKFVEVPPPWNVAQTSGIENVTMLAKAKSMSENEASGSGAERQGRTAPDEREEKIYYDAETGQEGGDAEEEEGVTMSATSYPGQEWNPYIGAGEWEDGFD